MYLKKSIPLLNHIQSATLRSCWWCVQRSVPVTVCCLDYFCTWAV